MDEPVSAFAIYRANKKHNSSKKKKNKKLTTTAPMVLSHLPEEIVNVAANKIRQKKKKESKDIKKKSHKKKKPNIELKRSNKSLSVSPKKSKKKAENDEIPMLVLAKPTLQEANMSDDEAMSSDVSSGFEFTPVQTDSSEEGLKVFKWMIAPYNPEEFLSRIWEKKPLHIARKKTNYYKELITTPIIDEMLRNENIQFTKNIDITSYIDGKRETHNPEGRAHPHLVWDYYLNGCSIRLLNPQTYIPKLHMMNATLQEFFNSFVGANAYLTPPDSQGFAPHYDDIEAFILQTEGKKHWRIYKPLNENEVLPRVSSKNFDQDEIGHPIMDVTLEAGDMLYFPRGYIHQGITIDGEHSLHVTISMYQKHSWADLFEKMIPAALQMAIAENVDFRHGLPFDLYDYFGIVNSDVKAPRRQEIKDLVVALFDRIKNYLPIDDSVDQMSKEFQHAALPPVLSDLEKAVTVFGDTDVMVENGKVTNRVEIGLDTRIRLLRKNILRIVTEDRIRVYYYVENSLEYHGSELPFIEIEDELAPAVETLITTYPEYIAVENLDIADDAAKLQLADALWGRGLIMTEYPLETIDDD